MSRPSTAGLTFATILLSFLLSMICGGVGLIAGVLAGFYAGLGMFDDAGDFTSMFVMPCVLLGGVAGMAVGAGFGALVGWLFGEAARQDGAG
ncbi:MAG: hypothetical protein AAGG48_31065 [Planctomycetota bacterium]